MYFLSAGVCIGKGDVEYSPSRICNLLLICNVEVTVMSALHAVFKCLMDLIISYLGVAVSPDSTVFALFVTRGCTKLNSHNQSLAPF
jgi:hypothetical protein